MKAMERNIVIEEQSSIKEVDGLMSKTVNDVYNIVLDSDSEIESLLSQWKAFSKKRRAAHEVYEEQENRIYRELLLSGINPEEDEIPEAQAKSLKEAKANLDSILGECRLGIEKVKIALQEKGFTYPSRFNPSATKVVFRFKRE